MRRISRRKTYVWHTLCSMSMQKRSIIRLRSLIEGKWQTRRIKNLGLSKVCLFCCLFRSNGMSLPIKRPFLEEKRECEIARICRFLRIFSLVGRFPSSPRDEEESPGQKYEKNRRRRPLHEAFAPVFHPFRLEGAVYQHFHSEPKETLGGIHNYASAIFMQNL